MKGINYRKQRAARDQIKSIIPMDDSETNSEFFGEDENISTQIVRNYYYSPRND